MAVTYKDAGVDVTRGYEAVKRMKEHVQKTMLPNVMGDLGSFGGFFALDKADCDAEPVLVAGTDGVGTKLKLAFIADKHDTVGIDCVAMCVNDIVCQGAKPLFFLDYIATGKIEPSKVADIVKGVADGCCMSGCSLIGGETAEMPGFYGDGEYDMAGFAVGIVDKKKAINGSRVQEGDVIVGLASSGIHSNGYSLVRKLFCRGDEVTKEYDEEIGGSLLEELLTPTRIYVKPVLELISKYDIHGIAHITGGGFIENIPRTLPEGLSAEIRLGSWEMKPVFNLMMRLGELTEEQAYNTFNMGIGMVLVVPAEIAEAVAAEARALEVPAYVIGRVIRGEEGVKLCK